MIKNYLILIMCFCLASCGTYFNQPLSKQDARIGETSPFTNALEQLPQPQEKVVVGVYNFKDQTGQYKSVENGSSFSTAVTQGGTSILIKALEDSRWFTPIERENLSNLLNERNIIRSTRQEYTGTKSGKSPVPPLLFAGVLLEGGVVSYDTNILTGGFGARYFGAGGSTQYKQDRITVYLRAISTSSGKILKTVYVSKTILSQAIDASLFRYVNFQRLLEVETGYTKNEPVQLAVKEAIEKAVESLIIEGIDGDIWQAAQKEEGEQLVEQYKKDKAEEKSIGLYHRENLDWVYNNAFSFNLGLNRFLGDFGERNFSYLAQIGYHKKIIPHLGFSLSANLMEFKIGNVEDKIHTSADLNAEVFLLPYDRFSPYVYGGPGVLMRTEKSNIFSSENSHFKVQYGLGLNYVLSPRFSLNVFAEHNLSFTDEIDAQIQGTKDDSYFNFGVGLKFNFGKRNN